MARTTSAKRVGSSVCAQALVEVVCGTPATRLEPLKGGISNAMYIAHLRDREPLVVRVSRDAKHARWLDVEAAVMTTARRVVPAPEVLLVDSTGAISGRSAMVMSFVEGVRAREVIKRDPATAGPVGRAVGIALGTLATVEVGDAGWFENTSLTPMHPASSDPLEGFAAAMRRADRGRPIRREHRDRWDVLVREHSDVIDYVLRGASLVHGDANASNFLVSVVDGSWTVTGVVDWEFSCSGTPLIDLAAALRSARTRPPAYATELGTGFESVAGPLPAGWQGATTLYAELQIDVFVRDFGGPLGYTPIAPLLRSLARRGVVG